METIPQAIIDAQSTGATMTSEEIVKAVASATGE